MWIVNRPDSIEDQGRASVKKYRVGFLGVLPAVLEHILQSSAAQAMLKADNLDLPMTQRSVAEHMNIPEQDLLGATVISQEAADIMKAQMTAARQKIEDELTSEESDAAAPDDDDSSELAEVGAMSMTVPKLRENCRELGLDDNGLKRSHK